MVFLYPAVLLLLLALPLVWIFPRGERSPAVCALRCLVFALLIGALAKPVRVSEEAPTVHVYVVDPGSDQLTQRVAEAASSAARLRDDEAIHLVHWGEALSEADETFDQVHCLATGISTSPIGSALDVAATLIPRGSAGAITLVTDGMSTREDWAGASAALSLRGIPVHTIAAQGQAADAYPVSLTADGPLRAGQTGRLIAEVVASSMRGRLVLSGPTGELASSQEFTCQDRVRIPIEFEPEAPGFLTVQLQLVVDEGANPIAENDTFEKTFPIDEPQRFLYLGQRVVRGDEVLSQLVGAGFHVDSWQGEQLSAEQLARYDLAVVDDLPAEALGESTQKALVDAVRDNGVGLFVSGGQSAFGAGGYHEQPLEEVLPVEFVQKEEKRDPSTTLVVIIDTSGSMGGNRVQLAKEVARLSIRRLLPHDKVGIVEFYGAKHWAAPIQPASNSIELERALNRLDAGGGTVILPAIEEAFYGLKNVQTRYKHVLVLTDGGVESGAFEPLLRNMAEDGINVSTVLIGPEAHSEFLVTLSNWGKGRFYAVPNRFNLPEILLKQPTSAKLPPYRPGRHSVQARGGSGWWGDVDLQEVPDLAGYVETRDRPGAEVLLETTEGGHPVLGSWRYGLGRVTAFTSEPTGPGTEPWKDWPGYGPWLARLLQRTASDQRATHQFTLERDGTHVTLIARSRRPGVGMPDVSHVDEEGQPTESIALRERAPGVFHADWFAPLDREVRVLAESGTEERTQRTRLVVSVSDEVARETQVDPARALDLALLSQVTGGVDVASAGGLAGFEPPSAGGLAPRSLQALWPWFALASLLVYLLEIFVRRREPARAA